MKKLPLEKTIFALLKKHDLTCLELMERSGAEEKDLALALWRLVRRGRIVFGFGHWATDPWRGFMVKANPPN